MRIANDGLSIFFFEVKKQALLSANSMRLSFLCSLFQIGFVLRNFFYNELSH